MMSDYILHSIRLKSWTGKGIALSLLLLVNLFCAQAQFYPVQVTTQIVPPYSVYLSDYATPGNEKLRLIMLQRDLTKPSYQIRLQLSIELNGRVILRTSPTFNPAPINLDPGAPMIISGTDLQPYVDSRNLEFIGISRETYERTKALPEGSYQICFTAYDYKRQDVPVSMPGCSFFWLAKNEPPLINYPACGTALPFQNPQQIVFSWLPRNTASPSSGNDTEYEFALYEIRPAGRNPNDVVQSSQPVYRTTTSLTQILYGIAEPVLLENMTYAWTIRASDTNGKDAFRNNGYSEVCTFTYGGTVSSVPLLPVENLQARGETERSAKAWWTPVQDVDGYTVYYKKKGSGYRWFSQISDKDTIAFFDLEADTEYELRVQSRVGTSYGPYSDIRPFRTLPKRVYQCGDEAPAIPAPENPLPFATIGMVIDIQGIEMIIKEVNGPYGAGIYTGKGEVSIPYFGGATFNVAFDRLQIDDTRTAVNGRVDFITKDVTTWVADELEKQRQEELAEQQQKNRDQWKDTDFYDKVFYYDGIAIDSMYVNSDGEVIIVGDDGKTYVNKDIKTILADAPDKAIIIEDKNGDQWVVQADGKVTRVPGGGLSPNMDVVVSAAALDMMKETLRALHIQYDVQNLATKEEAMNESRQLVDQYIDRYTDQVFDHSGTSTDSEEEISRGPLNFGFDEIRFENTKVDPEFKALSDKANQTELEYNHGVIVHFFGKPENIGAASELIAKELIVEDASVSVFVENQKKNGATNAAIIEQLKKATIDLMDKILKDSEDKYITSLKLPTDTQ